MIVTNSTDFQEIFLAFIPVLNTLADVFRYAEITDMYDKDTNFSGWCTAMAQSMQHALDNLRVESKPTRDIAQDIATVLKILEARDAKILSGPNKAFAEYIVQSLCEHDWEVDYSGMLYTSNPPRIGRHCTICRKTDTVSVNDDHSRN